MKSVVCIASLFLGLTAAGSSAFAAPADVEATKAMAPSIERKAGAAHAARRETLSPGEESAETRAAFRQRYAQRAASDAEAFEGGGAGVYIGGSTVAVVALLVLLLVVF